MVGEIWTAFEANKYNGIEITQLQLNANEALKGVGIANDRASKLEAKNLEMEAEIQPRTCLVNKDLNIYYGLGLHILIESYSGDIESRECAQQLAE